MGGRARMTLTQFTDSGVQDGICRIKLRVREKVGEPKAKSSWPEQGWSE